MRVLVIANAGAGAIVSRRFASRRAIAARLGAAFRAAGVDAEIMVFRGRGFAMRLAGLPLGGVDAVVAAGGDGTVGTVAALVAGTGVPFGVIPAGTLNHFAKDIGIPLRLEEAVSTVARGFSRAVDVGEVNGRIFVNNSSIGLYPRMVRRRDHQRLRLGRGKWLAMFLAALRVARRFPVLEVRLTFGADTVARTTPFVFVGNNEYQMHLFSLGGRSRLDEGKLSVYVGNRTGRFGMLRLALRALFGRLSQAADFDQLSGAEFVVDTQKRRLHVAVDGELLYVKPPLRYRTLPGALRVLVPSTPEEPER
jgi:diacylglycerol kinase family enzyme